MAKLFNFEVHTPYRLFFSDQVEAIVLRAQDGDMGVLADHSFMTAPVLTGILKIKGADGAWKAAYTSEGILEVSGHKTILMADTAEWPEEIDRVRAEAARDRARERAAAGLLKFESDNAAADLRRAETRLRVLALYGAAVPAK